MAKEGNKIENKNCYSGDSRSPSKIWEVETFAEELVPRLVKKGHRVIVYGRLNIIKEYKAGDYYRGEMRGTPPALGEVMGFGWRREASLPQ